MRQEQWAQGGQLEEKNAKWVKNIKKDSKTQQKTDRDKQTQGLVELKMIWRQQRGTTDLKT